MSLLQGGNNNAWASDYVITMLSGTQITGTSNQVKKFVSLPKATPPKPAAFGRLFCARVRFPKRQTSCRKVK